MAWVLAFPVLKEDAKSDFVSDDNPGDFKTIIWWNTELGFAGESFQKTEKSWLKIGGNSEKIENSSEKNLK